MKRKASKPPRLTDRQVTYRVFRRLKRYDKLSDLEQFAMFMGKAQVLELGLKRLLHRIFNYDHDRMEKWTLGRTTRELKDSGLRRDFIALLEAFADYRNHIAHEYLANEALLRRILGRDIGRLERKYLERGIFKVEEALLIYDWLEQHGAWLLPAAAFSAPNEDTPAA
jgi:hypothetical protein